MAQRTEFCGEGMDFYSSALLRAETMVVLPYCAQHLVGMRSV
jgi:hypothetical protein